MIILFLIWTHLLLHKILFFSPPLILKCQIARRRKSSSVDEEAFIPFWGCKQNITFYITKTCSTESLYTAYWKLSLTRCLQFLLAKPGNLVLNL